MAGYWNIRKDGYFGFTEKIREFAEQEASRDIIYSDNEWRVSSQQYPLLIAKGKMMSRTMVYRLVKFYCNKKGLFYAPGALDEIVDMVYMGQEQRRKKEMVSNNIRNLLAYKRAREQYQQQYQQRIQIYGNPWNQYIN